MTAFCGVMSGLVESKVSDMVMYNVDLYIWPMLCWFSADGLRLLFTCIRLAFLVTKLFFLWRRYLSTLYSHPDWPNKSPRELREELRDNIASSPVWLLTNPPSMYRYLTRIMAKRRQGQPVSFTDFFGHLVGETLLKGVSMLCILYWLLQKSFQHFNIYRNTLSWDGTIRYDYRKWMISLQKYRTYQGNNVSLS